MYLCKNTLGAQSLLLQYKNTLWCVSFIYHAGVMCWLNWSFLSGAGGHGQFISAPVSGFWRFNLHTWASLYKLTALLTRNVAKCHHWVADLSPASAQLWRHHIWTHLSALIVCFHTFMTIDDLISCITACPLFLFFTLFLSRTRTWCHKNSFFPSAVDFIKTCPLPYKLLLPYFCIFFYSILFLFIKLLLSKHLLILIFILFMQQITKSNSLYVQTYSAINLFPFLILLFLAFKVRKRFV